MKIVRIVGARPQFMQVPTLYSALTEHGFEQTLVHTGQHYDDNMSRIFFDELALPRPDVHLKIGSKMAGAQTGAMITELEKTLLSESPDLVVVDGDTNSTAAGTLAAVKQCIPVAHIESGVRCGIFYQPEEINRKVTDHLSELLFAPSPSGLARLEAEGLATRSVYTGDLMLDTFLKYQHRHDHAGASRLTADMHTYAVATLHRAETTSDYETLFPYLSGIANLEMPTIFPAHPRLRRLIDRFENDVPNHKIRFSPPVGYLTMMALLSGASLVITDSGGLTREGPFSGKPVVLAADSTAWTDLVDLNYVVPWSPKASSLPASIEKLVTVDIDQVHKMFGGGKAATVISQKIRDWGQHR